MLPAVAFYNGENTVPFRSMKNYMAGKIAESRQYRKSLGEIKAGKTKGLFSAAGNPHSRMNMTGNCIVFLEFILNLCGIMNKPKRLTNVFHIVNDHIEIFVNLVFQAVMIAFNQVNLNSGYIRSPPCKPVMLLVVSAVK